MTGAATVAVLYPGEMGVSLSRLLMGRGVRVVTTLQGRGPSTALRCREAGVNVLGSLRDVVRVAGMVISVVPPAMAEAVAGEYCDLAHQSAQGALYVDANSIGPALAESLSDRLRARGVDFVDAAINGLASNAAAGGTLFVSGPRAAEVARLFEGAMRVQVLGNVPGAASAMKMALGGLAKGLCALFTEMAVLADRHAMLPEMLEASARIYPGPWAIVERMLPTYPLHAARRATEMRQVEQTLREAGVRPMVMAAVRQVHEQWAATDFSQAGADDRWTVASIVRHLTMTVRDSEPSLDV